MGTEWVLTVEATLTRLERRAVFAALAKVVDEKVTALKGERPVIRGEHYEEAW